MVAGSILHYRIERKLGEGGMGEVFLATDTKLDRKVALKFLPASLSADPQARERLSREARAASRLTHPNIVTVYAVEESEGRSFIAMEYIEGDSLADLIRREELSRCKALDIVIQICEGLQAAHDQGIIHRDITPANILIAPRGQARISDFGIARWRDTTSITKDTAVKGTIGYMSPEQAQQCWLDERSDLFSVGVVLYELLCGRRPFDGDYMAAVVYDLLNTDPEPLSRYCRDIPEEIQRIVTKILAKKPDDRYQSATDLLEDLRAARDQHVAGIAGQAQPEDRALPSIAVLPFTDMSPLKDQEYFCDGMAEELINALTKIRGMRVVARTSAFAFKGQNVDLRQVGRVLNVRTVMEGSVRTAGDRLRVTAQLVNVNDGYHVWSDRYDRQLKDVFAVQDEISLAIVRELRVTLLGEERTQLARRHTTDIEAYDLYLRGRFFWSQRGPGLLKAIEYYQRALKHDPDYALAHAGLADSFMLLGFYGYLRPKDACSRAEEAARKALELDPNLAEARCALGFVLMTYRWDWAAAEREFLHAAELNPQYAPAYYWYATAFIVRGQYDLGLEVLDRALTADPLCIMVNTVRGWALAGMRRYDAARKQLQRALELNPQFPLAHYALSLTYTFKADYEVAIAEMQKAVTMSHGSATMTGLLGWTYGVSGHREEAQASLRELKERSKSEYVRAYLMAMIHMSLGEHDEGLNWLLQAAEEHDLWLVLVGMDPAFQALHANPKYIQLLKRIGIGSASA